MRQCPLDLAGSGGCLLRREALLDPTFLVALTGWGREEDKRIALKAGFDAHIVMPVSLDALRELVARVRQQMGVADPAHTKSE